MEDFLHWKDLEEKASFSYYSEQYGVKDGNLYFYCQQDGPQRIRNDPNCYKKRSGNRKGRIKTGAVCISMIKVKIQKDKTVAVEYHPGHNHEIDKSDLKHQPLPTVVNSFIKRQLAMGVSPSKLHKEIQGGKFSQKCGVSDSELSRCDFINVKRLRELRRRMAAENKLAPDDSTAVKMLVESLQSEGFDPVLLYKPNGSEVLIGPTCGDPLPNDIFMLAIHTREQSEMLQHACETVLIVDVTYDVELYGAQLVNLIGVDEFNRGFPLAHFISNQVDHSTLKYFFTAVKENFKMKINCVLSKEDPLLIDSMSANFDDTLCHLLCTWNFKISLEKELVERVANEELEDLMYRELCFIIDSQTESEFDELVDVFVKTHGDSQKSFVDFFIESCLPMKTKWAMCFRDFFHGHVDTLVYAEAFHTILTNLYVRRNPQQGIATLLDCLLEIGEDYFTRRNTAVNAEDMLNEISIRHRRGMQIPNSHVKMLQVTGKMSWLIQSQSKEDMTYHIVRSSTVCTWPDTCLFHCDGIDACNNLCSHMYVCTCADDALMCKHIHKIHTSFPVLEDFSDSHVDPLDCKSEEGEIVLSVPPDSLSAPSISVTDCPSDVEVVLSIPEDTMDPSSSMIDYGDIVVISVPGDDGSDSMPDTDGDEVVYYIQDGECYEQSPNDEDQEILDQSDQPHLIEESSDAIETENLTENDEGKREELQTFLAELQNGIQSENVVNALYPYLRDNLHKLTTQCRTVMSKSDD